MQPGGGAVAVPGCDDLEAADRGVGVGAWGEDVGAGGGGGGGGDGVG